MIKFKDHKYCPSFWPEEVWPWSGTRSFSKITKQFWDSKNIGMDFISFMKLCVKRCLQEADIDPKDHVNPHHDREVLKRWRRKRGIATSPERSSSESSEDNRGEVDEDVENNISDVDDNGNNDQHEVNSDASNDSDIVAPGRFVRRLPAMTYDSATTSTLSSHVGSPPSRSSSHYLPSPPPPTSSNHTVAAAAPLPTGRRMPPENVNEEEHLTLPTRPVRMRRPQR